MVYLRLLTSVILHTVKVGGSMQNMERWLLMMVAILLVLVAVMVFAQYGEDGTVIFSGDGESTAILVLGAVAGAVIVGFTIVNKNVIASFERLSVLANNPILMNEVARRYQMLPPMTKKATDILIDIADAMADMTQTDEDNKVIDRLREALDSKEKSLEPSVDARHFDK